MTTHTSTDDNTFAWDELPEIVALYLRAHVTQDYATAVTHLSEGVTVLDDGHVLHGREETLEVFDKSANDYEVEITLRSISRPADDVWEVDTHLSGNFPGGEVDLRMLFTLADDAIRKLEITV
ncbi:nuclear transport factor 2 family protein [Nocardioides dongxiaopingii]|uniref:nuclear transport factor 2 family protein n=1 Tax=Nocardioides sp. S-1144 TaxID=2582905 RepID=UPI00110F3EF1|nr:nuclear transport factor 2 family protein [Nocardioides sp. S-1144]QCW52120.1 nuclear transport factor 2 family protein [Nocardioides sp. S-1144]